jgi:glycosyltransferase involved in cell wall biosynthesis
MKDAISGGQQLQGADSMVTVILFTYNRERYVGKAIQAILCQTYRDFDLYILDNHSDDGTREIVEGFDDPRIHYIRHESNIGAIGNGEYAYHNLIKGEYIVFTHDDDMMGATMLEKEIGVMEQIPDVVVVSPNMNLMDESDQVKVRGAFGIDRDILYKKYEFIDSFIQGKNFICTPAVMLRGSFLRERGIVPDSSFGPASDAMFWSQINMDDRNLIYVMREPLYNYRLHDSQMSAISGYRMSIELDEHYRPFLLSIGKIFVEKYDRYFVCNMLKKIIIDYCEEKCSLADSRKGLKEIKTACGDRFSRKDKILLVIFTLVPSVFRYLLMARRALSPGRLRRQSGLSS